MTIRCDVDTKIPDNLLFELCIYDELTKIRRALIRLRKVLIGLISVQDLERRAEPWLIYIGPTANNISFRDPGP